MKKELFKIGLGISLVASSLLADVEKKNLKIGFIALTDSAPIIIAKEKGFFDKYGLNVEVIKEGGGWAGIQQKVISGEYDVAHALAGMPIASTIGINGDAHMYALMSLDLNGNAITMSNNIIKQMEQFGLDSKQRPVSADSLKKVINDKKAKEKNYKPMEFGVVYPVSTHMYEMRYWLGASKINPDTETSLKVFPPPQMVANLKSGNIEGYCVGEPWNERAVMEKMGSALITNYDIWQNNPEKVLQATASFVDKNPKTTKAMMKAILEAQIWLDGSWENRKEASKILSMKQYVYAPVDVLEMSMIGTFQYLKDYKAEPNPQFNVFANNYAAYPFYSHGMWFITQMYRWGQIDKPLDMKATIQKVYRPDIFEEVAKEVGYKLPPSAWKIDGIDEFNKFIDGKIYDPNKAVEYIYSFDVVNSKVTKDELSKVNKWSVKTAQPKYECPYGVAGCADPKYVTK